MHDAAGRGEGERPDGPEVRLDYERPRRKGIGEVIYCPGKSDSQMLSIAASVRAKGVNMAFSRMSPEQAALLADGRPPLEYDAVSRLGVIKNEEVEPRGVIAVLSAGSSDVPVASEAAGIAELHGCRVKKFFDVGVAGLHRLMGILPEIMDADVVIVAAGMDGALPSVVAGLAPGLVIGLPTSVGYGVATGGHAALNSMLSSCSPGLVVVNIDNGVGAGLSAVIAARGKTAIS
ncbi:MAG: nickel pincer cofactor biosynthesis protein LarB [Synergistaceae bacterium]|jgi:NCAIR mutase (PurE)-related protein|nr:nickel pincer cofactor biosynthesis protein LarB [Synergistaceae bacterium]